MQNRDIVVIGASAGGIEALREIARGLPPDLPAAVFATLHLPSTSSGMLASLLAGPARFPQCSRRTSSLSSEDGSTSRIPTITFS